LGLALGLVSLAVRAAYASAGFMAPGGAILGWTSQPVAQCSLCHVVVPTPTGPRPLTPEQYAALLLPHLTLDQELGQMIMIQFAASAVTPDLTQMIYSQRVGGVLLLGRPVQPSDQTLNAQLQRLAGIPLLVAIDQEGGFVNRFSSIAGPLPSAASLPNPAAALTRGKLDATLLHAYGFNLNFAPMVDVGSANPIGQFVGRTFSTDPTQVAAMAGAYIQGLQQSGQVTACPKHWPGGLVETGMDPHVRMPVLNSSQAQWEQTDVAPYRTLLKTREVRAIMVSHEMIPQVDANLPTSLSPTIVDGTLRAQLGFDGVVITDDLVSMQAITDSWGLTQATVLAIKAGDDIVAALATPGQVQDTLNALKQQLTTGGLTRARIDTSARRILALKIRMGLIPLPAPTHHDKGGTPQAASDLPASWLMGRVPEQEELA
jgi:beta-N-acetylhexosaminidase